VGHKRLPHNDPTISSSLTTRRVTHVSKKTVNLKKGLGDGGTSQQSLGRNGKALRGFWGQGQYPLQALQLPLGEADKIERRGTP